MTSPFEITKQDVADLDDIGLRNLIQRLLEAEAAHLGVPLSAIDVGGAQSAPDGGVDAAIRWQSEPQAGGWLPRPFTVIQCKATKMPAALIRKEMRPGDRPRPIFAELAQAHGAYLLATTEDFGSVAGARRLTAMRRALDDVDGADAIAIDLYGADRLARWANEHAGVAMWVREQAGRDLMGWRPLEGWSGGGDAPYILDERSRVVIDGAPDQTVGQAIDAIRGALALPRAAVRMVGVSGVGKTRLAEALFDQHVGSVGHIKPAYAIYGDAGHLAAASAPTTAERLAVSGQRAVLVVDNCAEHLHRQLADIVRRYNSRTSLLTIDYELTTDGLHQTTIIRLGEGSDAAINGLIAQRFPSIGSIVRHRLAEFAGGNARIALAISRGVEVGDTLSDLTDLNLIDRLFQIGWRGDGDMSLRTAAEVASLVYAFHADDTPSYAAENTTLASLAELSDQTFYAAIERGLDLGIAQRRGPQRAIKPDALADRLATIRLKQSDPASLLAAFAAGPSRLLASFARRLGRLHNEPKAVLLANQLLSPEGWLGDISLHDDRMCYAFAHVAPAAQEATLAAIERAVRTHSLSDHGERYRVYAEALVHIAWDRQLFARAMTSLAALAQKEPTDSNQDTATRLLVERFRPNLSFTMADGADRLAFLDKLIDEGGEASDRIVVGALAAMLSTGDVTSFFQTEFGARIQATEWKFRDQQQIEDWFDGAYQRLESFALLEGPVADKARSAIILTLRSNVLHGLGARSAQAVRTVRPANYWDEGWRAVSQVLSYDDRLRSDDTRMLFRQLERDLRPDDLESCFQAFVLGKPYRHPHPRAHGGRNNRDNGLLARACGVAVVASGEALMPWLERATVANHATGPLAFVRGLVARRVDPDGLWEQAVSTFKDGDHELRRPAVLSGVLRAVWEHDPSWVRARLDEVAIDPDLAPHSIILTPDEAIDGLAVDRWMLGLDRGILSPSHVELLLYGGASTHLAATDLARLLRRLSNEEGGAVAALNILYFRRHSDQQENRPAGSELECVQRSLLVDPRCYAVSSHRIDHEATALARELMPDQELARGVARALKASSSADVRLPDDFAELTELLVETHLKVVLDEFVDPSVNDLLSDGLFSQRFDDDSNLAASDRLDRTVVLDWIGADPQPRALKLAGLIPYAVSNDGGASLSWSPLALALIENAFDPVTVLSRFHARFYTGSSTGPFYLRVERRLPLIDTMVQHPRKTVRAWARTTRNEMEATIARWQESEAGRSSVFE